MGQSEFLDSENRLASGYPHYLKAPMIDREAAKALRRFCLECQGGHAPSVQRCTDKECVLHAFRQCTVDPLPEDARPLRAIRRHCLSCAGSRAEARSCAERAACPLWSYRFGVLPATFRRVSARRRRFKETLTLPGLRLL